jgi:hypothetical protein
MPTPSDVSYKQLNGESLNISMWARIFWYLANGHAGAPSPFRNVPVEHVQSLASDAQKALGTTLRMLGCEDQNLKDAVLTAFIAGMLGQKLFSLESAAIKRGRENSLKKRSSNVDEFTATYGEEILKRWKATGVGWQHLIEELLTGVPESQRPAWRSVYNRLRQKVPGKQKSRAV